MCCVFDDNGPGGDSRNVPSPRSLMDVVKYNTDVATHAGKMMMVFAGTDTAAIWLIGTNEMHCEKPPSGQWSFIVSNLELFKGAD